MFDRMIVSNERPARSRSGYFAVTGLMLLSLFIGAVVASILAANIDLGVDLAETRDLLMPVAAEEPDEPAPPSPAAPPNNTLIADIRPADRVPRTPPANSYAIPQQIGTRPSRGTQRLDRFGPLDSVSTGSGTQSIPGEWGQGERSVGGSSAASNSPNAEPPPRPVPPPPPIKPKPEPPRAAGPPISLGPVNGRAVYLLKPPYPKTAEALRLSGSVTVRVVIGVDGNVISAKAESGHPMFRDAAERAARAARFTPATLSNVPVKATGVITYNFIR